MKALKCHTGEQVSQLQHAQQASKHAQEAEQADHVILGTFLHDIGHLVGLENKMEQVSNLLSFYFIGQLFT
jgi:predicted HD phosphohydrolase